jgi:hypothetical protein
MWCCWISPDHNPASTQGGAVGAFPISGYESL